VPFVNKKLFCLVPRLALTETNGLNKRFGHLGSLPFGVFWARLPRAELNLSLHSGDIITDL